MISLAIFKLMFFGDMILARRMRSGEILLS